MDARKSAPRLDQDVVLEKSSQPWLVFRARVFFFARLLYDAPVKKLFGATPGYVFCEADYSQLELRVAAMLCGDPTMIHDILTPIPELGRPDIHTLGAAKAYKMTPLEIQATRSTKDDLRFKYKFVIFGILYGRGAYSLTRTTDGIGGTLEEAQFLIDSIFTTYPGLYEWMKEQQRHARTYGEQQSILGRKRRYHVIDHRVERQCLNFPIASPASDYNCRSFNRLTQALRGRDLGYPLFMVHDACTAELRIDRLPEAVETIVECMEFTIDEMYFPVEIKIGHSWGEGKVVWPPNEAELSVEALMEELQCNSASS